MFVNRVNNVGFYSIKNLAKPNFSSDYQLNNVAESFDCERNLIPDFDTDYIIKLYAITNVAPFIDKNNVLSSDVISDNSNITENFDVYIDELYSDDDYEYV